MRSFEESRRRGAALPVALALVAVVAVVASSAVDAPAAAETAGPAEIDWQRAVAMNHPAVADFRNPGRLPPCRPPEEWTGSADATDGAGSCFARPETLGLRFVTPRDDCTLFPEDGDYLGSARGCLAE